MQSRTYRTISLIAVALLMVMGVAFASVAGYLTVPSAGAQATDPQPIATPAGEPVRTITVVGAGRVSISPDIARVHIGVETVRTSVQEASAENRETLEDVIEALMEGGVAENDIQTSGFSVYAERYGPEGPLADDQVRYRVSNNVQIVVRDLESIGELLDAAIEAGANNIYGVEFSLDDTSVVEAEAREGAVENAQEKAANLAELNNVNVGRVLSISEVIGGVSPVFQDSMMRFGGGGGTPIAPGELQITLHLQVVYELVD